jgi:drug/metabolite transporter (DMT)-like permease
MRARADIGLLAALGSALAYGITVVIGRSLARDGFEGTPVLACRFGMAGLVLVIVQARRGSLLPAVGERWRSVGLGVLYALQSSMFFAALGRGSAAAVSLVFYSYPAMVAIAELARHTLRWSAHIGAAMALSVGGVLTVVAVGGQLSITGAGVLYGLAAAALFALFVLAGKQLVHRTEAVIRALWTTGAAAITQLVLAFLSGDSWPGVDRLPALVGYGAATAAAFGLVFVALRRIGPTRTSVVLNFEVVASVALAAVFLDEQLSALQALGGAAVVAGAILVARE